MIKGFWTKVTPTLFTVATGGVLVMSLSNSTKDAAGFDPIALMQTEVSAAKWANTDADASEEDLISKDTSGVIEPDMEQPLPATPTSHIENSSCTPPVDPSPLTTTPPRAVPTVAPASSEPALSIAPAPVQTSEAPSPVTETVAPPPHREGLSFSYPQPGRDLVSALLRDGRLILRLTMSDGRQFRFVPAATGPYWSGGSLSSDIRVNGAMRLSSPMDLVPIELLRGLALRHHPETRIKSVAVLVSPAETARIHESVSVAASSARLPNDAATSLGVSGCWDSNGFRLLEISQGDTRHKISSQACHPA